MLTISFPGQPTAQAIILEEPCYGVSGAIECTLCNGRLGLFHEDEGQLSNEVEEFIKNHRCFILAREAEVSTFAENLKRELPSASIEVKKGRKIMLKIS